MAKYQSKFIRSVLIALVLFVVAAGYAGTKESSKNGARLSKTAGYTNRLSNISNNEFYITNYGEFGHNVATGSAGWYWPRQSNRSYIFGQSVWFGVKRKTGNDTLKLVTVGYNPNSGACWLVPGSIDDGLSILEDSDPLAAKYYLYMGTDFTPAGKNVKNPGFADWPIRWKDQNQTPGKAGYFGEYISDPGARAQYPPVFISQEDMFSVFKDTDIKKNPEYKPGSGYPIGLDIQNTVYSWGFGPYRDFVFFVYNVINKSGDTLRSCYLAPAADCDIGSATIDHNAFYSHDPSLNMAFQFTETQVNYNGVIGMDFLESPKVKSAADSVEIYNATGRSHNIGEQIGLTTFRNWTIDVDPSGGPARYDFMASGVRDADNGPGDKRLLMATGPFTMNPGDTARTVLCIMLAPGRGSWNDPPDVQGSHYLDSLVALDKFAQTVYDNNFAAPKPPDPAKVTASGINGGVIVQWDNTSEASIDTLSGGAAFYGYRVHRSRSQSGPWKLLMDTSMSTAPAGTLPSAYLPHSFIDIGTDTTGGLVNNIDYYYWVSSFDQGDPIQGIKPLENTPVANLNSVRVQPVGPSAGNDVKFENYAIPVKLGSIKNFRIEPTNQLRFNQLVSGHALKVSMKTINSGSAYTDSITVEDAAANYNKAIVFNAGLEVSPTTLVGDTTRTSVYRSIELYNCYKIAFDYSFIQRYKPFNYDTTKVTKGAANTAAVRKGFVNPSVNLGEAAITLDFTAGGSEEVAVAAGDTVTLSYLNVVVKNVTTGETFDTTSETNVSYKQWAINTILWKTSAYKKTLTAANKYYLSAVIGTDTIKLAHVLRLNGQEIAIDPFNLGGTKAFARDWAVVPKATQDFSAGDQITNTFTGGVAGTGGEPPFPLPGAVITTTATNATPAKYTAELLKQIKVVPNPYIISHIGQLTTDAPKLYFNHLPPICTIRIYNVAGELIKVLEHNGGSQEVWDLLSDGRQKIASQLLIAYVKTPDGANQMVKFAVIVGGFRSIR
jgi:hypothetical protein